MQHFIFSPATTEGLSRWDISHNFWNKTDVFLVYKEEKAEIFKVFQ